MTFQIRLEKWVTAKDGEGNNTEQVVSKVNVFAEVIRTTGGRSVLNGVTGLSDVYTFRMRFNPKFTTSGNWRVIYDGKVFTIHSIEKEHGTRFWLLIKATSKGDGIHS